MKRVPRLARLVVLVAVSALIGSLAACADDGFDGAEAEVKKTNIKLDLPPVPQFDVPSFDGEHRSVKELRLNGRSLFDSELDVKGYIVWVYDCLEEQREPGMTDKDVQKKIDEDPTICNRPHVILGDTADTPPEKGIWVVELPRALRKDEERGLKRKEIAEHNSTVPEVAVGDEVIVKGKWNNTSPHGFANSEGLLIFAEIENLTRAAPEGDQG